MVFLNLVNKNEDLRTDKNLFHLKSNMNFYHRKLNNEQVIFLEKNNDNKVNYILSSNEDLFAREGQSSKFTDINCVYFIKKTFRDIFLPQGYPFSVSSDYVTYQIWDTIQAFCSTISGTLTTHAIFKAVGVGDKDATALAATITWIIKDGTGMLGRIGFAWWKGYSLDTDCKKWRFAADVINDVAMCLELLLRIEALKYYSFVILCLSTSMKAIVGVAGGATKAAVSQHQAIRGNMADVSAKDGSQETCVNLLASLFAVFLLTKIENNVWCVWLLFTLITLFHLYANYKAVKCLKMKTLNVSRLLLLIRDHLQYNYLHSTDKINDEESVFLGFGVTDWTFCSRRIHLGCSVRKIIERKKRNVITFEKLKIKYATFSYIIVIDDTSINVILREKLIDKDIIMAYYHAVILGIVLHHCDTYENLTPRYNEQFCNLIRDCRKSKSTENYVNEFVLKNWNEFCAGLLANDWIISRHQLSVDEWRLKYD